MSELPSTIEHISTDDDEIAKFAEDIVNPIVKEAIENQIKEGENDNMQDEDFKLDSCGDKKSEKSCSDEEFEYLNKDDMSPNQNDSKRILETTPDSNLLDEPLIKENEDTEQVPEPLDTLLRFSPEMHNTEENVSQPIFEPEKIIDSLKMAEDESNEDSFVEDDNNKNEVDEEKISEQDESKRHDLIFEEDNLMDNEKLSEDEDERLNEKLFVDDEIITENKLYEQNESLNYNLLMDGIKDTYKVEKEEKISEKEEEISEKEEEISEKEEDISEKEEDISEKEEEVSEKEEEVSEKEEEEEESVKEELFVKEKYVNKNKLESAVGESKMNYVDDKDESLSKANESISSKKCVQSHNEFKLKLQYLTTWKNPLATGLVFGAVLLFQIALMCDYSVISLISYCGFMILFSNLFCKIASKFNLMKSCPFSSNCSSLNFNTTDMQHVIDHLLVNLELILEEIKGLAFAVSLSKNIKAFVFFYILTYIGSWFNLSSLIFMVTILLFSVPLVYNKYDREINKAYAEIKLAADEKLNNIKLRLRTIMGRQ